MKFRHTLFSLLAGAFLGLIAGLVAGGTSGSPLARAADRLGWTAPETLTRTTELEQRFRDLQDRTAALETLQKQLTDLETQDLGGVHAYMEAKRLGILAEVARQQPEMRPSAVRRMGMAIVSEARANSLDPLLLTAVAQVESRFNPYATSPVGALGVFQLTPPTGRTMATATGSFLGAPNELYDIETNVALGAHYLAQLVRQFSTVDAALLAYNRGIGGAKAVLRSDDAHRALQGYPREVLAVRDRLARKAPLLE